MANIRRQSIKGTIWVYTGFAIGAFITFLFTYKSWFSPLEYGLTRSILDIGSLVFVFSCFGSTFYLYKFFPYYKDNLPSKQNDLLGLAIKISTIGFIIVVAMLYLLEPNIIRKFSAKSLLLVQYFYLTIPAGFFMLMYGLLEAYSYGFSKGVTTNFIKETAMRLFTLIIVLLKVFAVINFTIFINLFALQFAIATILLAWVLYKEDSLWISFKTSRVTKKFKKNIINIVSLTFLTQIVSVLRISIDTLVLASKQDLAKVAIFGFITYLVMMMQAPIRSVSAITIPILSRYWKEKNLYEIGRIYKRSSINLLTYSVFIFCFILLNFTPVIQFLNLNEVYLEGKMVFILLGVTTILELGTGVNAQIIGTSSFFRFELWTSILLTALIIPLSYFLTVKYGILGPAAANLLSFAIYNFIRFAFLYRKFNMQPFSSKTLEVLIIAAIGFLITHYVFAGYVGVVFIIFRAFLFSILFITPVFFRNISPDFKPVVDALKKRVGK